MSTEDNNVTWREMLLDKMQGTGESWGDILGIDVKGEDDKRLTNEYPFCEDNEAVRLCDLAVDQLTRPEILQNLLYHQYSHYCMDNRFRLLFQAI